MKKTISIILIISVMFTSFSPSLCAEQTDVSYEGINVYKSLYDNINFTDIKDHWAKESIYLMSALSIIRGMGNNKFGPEDMLTRKQALALLIRMLGLEENAQKVAMDSVKNLDTGGYKIFSQSDYFTKGYIDTSLSNNIIIQEELDEINNLTQEEQDKVLAQIEKAMEKYESNTDLSSKQLDNIETLYTQKIENNFAWDVPAKREEVGVWVARVLSLEPINGSAQQMIYTLKDLEDINIKNIPIIEALMQNGIMQGSEGYFRPKETIKRAEMAKLLQNISEELFINRGYKIYSGIVEDISEENQQQDGNNIIEKTFRLKNDNGEIVEIRVCDSDNITNDKGFIIFKQDKLALPSDININDYIKYYIDPDGNVVFALALNKSNETLTIEGYINNISSNGEIEIESYDGEIHRFRAASNVIVNINSREENINQLLAGMECKAEVNKDSIISISATTNTGEAGYIRPGQRVSFGKVLYIDLKDKILTILDDGKQKEFTLENTQIISKNRNITLDKINEGDTVRLAFNEHLGDNPSKIYIVKSPEDIQRIVKGKITSFNSLRDEIILDDIYNYDHTKWNKSDGYEKISLSSDMQIYLKGVIIDKENLNNYKGNDVYIITKNDFGKEKINKLVVKEGYEKKFSNRVQDIEFGTKNLKVDYEDISYNDSTIFIKDGRLIDPYNITINDEASVITHGAEEKIASLVSITNTPNIGYEIYRGMISEIGKYSFEIRNYKKLEQNNWKLYSRIKEFNISDDTEILDTKDKPYKNVTSEEFINSRYLRKDGKYNNYYDDYVYVLEYNDMANSINVIEKNDEAQVVSLALAQEIDVINKKILLKDVEDWSEFNGRLALNTASINLEVDKALLTKDGQAIEIDDINPNDKLYILRTNEVGYIVIVR